MDGARHRRNRKENTGVVWWIVVVVPAASLDLATDLGHLSGRHDLVVLTCAKDFPAARRQRRALRRFYRGRGFVTKTDARLPESRRSDVARGSKRYHRLHHDWRHRISGGEPGHHL